MENRPKALEKQFQYTVGHTHAKSQLVRAIRNNRLPHAYLIQGPEGAGLFALALDMALLLLCQEPEKPCLACESCRQVMTNAHRDLQVYHPFPSADALKMKEDEYWQYMRSEVSQLVQSPYQRLLFEKEANYSIHTLRQMQQNMEAGKRKGDWRVVVLCEVDRMQEEGANSLLKTLEEPRSGILFLLLTSRPFLLLPTIASRCQTIRLGQLSQKEILAYLHKTQPETATDRLKLAAALSNGSISRALEFLEGELEPANDLAMQWIQTAEGNDPQQALQLVADLLERKDRGFLRRIMEILLIMVRDACILESNRKFTLPLQFSPERAIRYVRAVKHIIGDLESNVIPNVLLYTSIRNLQKDQT